MKLSDREAATDAAILDALGTYVTAYIKQHGREPHPDLVRLFLSRKASQVRFEQQTGQAYPTSIDEWCRLAARAGIPYQVVEHSSLADIQAHIEGYLQRLTDGNRLEHQPKPDTTLETAATWPPPDGWAFRPGEAAYKGTRIPVRGIAWKLLNAIVKTDRALTVDDLTAAGWEPEDEPETGTIRSHLSTLRGILRRNLSLSETFDPLPRCDRGDLLAWQLHPDLR